MSDVKKSKVFFECDPADKSAWVKAAKSNPKGSSKLDAWIIKTLNDAVSRIDLPQPEWMTFSPALNHVLIKAKIFKKQELIERIKEDSIFNIEGMDRNNIAELNAWYLSENIIKGQEKISS